MDCARSDDSFGRAFTAFSFLYGLIITLIVAQVQLAGPGYLLLGIQQHLFPLSQPARGPWNGEKDRKHVDRETHRLVDDARIEIDVGIELSAHEIIVFQSDALQLQG